MKTPAERQQALRDARKAAGLVLVRIWATKSQARQLQEFFALLTKKRRKAKEQP